MSTLPPELAEAIYGTREKTGPGRVSRRDFIRLSSLASGGLLIAFQLGRPTSASAATKDSDDFKPNGFIHIEAEGKVILYASNPEVGQGVKTSLPMILAEELDVPWESVEVKQSGIDAKIFGRQAAGGSRATPVMWTPLREAAATAKFMLIAAAAKEWKVSHEECEAKQGFVLHSASGKKASYPSLAVTASKMPVPEKEQVVLKDKKDYTLLGRWIPGVDNRDIVTGNPLFGIDEKVPGMVYASFLKCPHFGGKVKSANLDEIKKLSGVTDVFVVEGTGKPEEVMPGIAVIGISTWDCFEAMNKLKVEWDLSEASKESWSDYVEQAKTLSTSPGKIVAERGNAADIMESSSKVIESEYLYPFGYHANLEPQNCTAWFHDGTMEVWAPTQTPQWLSSMLADLLKLDKENILIHQKRIGGGFGRRLLNDYACEAAWLAREVGKPVKLTWTREQDVAHDFQRVGGYHRLRAAVDEKGKLTGLTNHFVDFSTEESPDDPVRGGGISEDIFPFPVVPNLRLDHTLLPTKIPCGWWRAPRSCTLGWTIQSFLHEVSTLGGRDHLEFLLDLFSKPEADAGGLNPQRAIDVLKKAASEGNWGAPMPKGHGRGLAFYFSHAGHFAEVVELHVNEKNKVFVDRVVVAGDVGLIVNRSGAENQVEGSVIDGLSMMALGETTFEDGKIEQTNFHDYPLLRMPSTPKIEIHFIESDYSPTGLGEPALPPLPPAVCNAIFEATGKRIRKLPIKREGFTI